MKKAFEKWWDRKLHLWPYRILPSGWWEKAFSAGYRAGKKSMLLGNGKFKVDWGEYKPEYQKLRGPGPHVEVKNDI